VQKIRKVSVSPLPPGYSAEWCAAVKSMLRRAPDDRPTVSTLLTQAFMQTALRSARARAVRRRPSASTLLCNGASLKVRRESSRAHDDYEFSRLFPDDARRCR
jgi:hypothetical protein